MENILIYILQVNMLLSLIYLGYAFLLKSLTFYRLNRVYFVAGTVYAIVFPFIDLSAMLRQKMSLKVPLMLDYIPLEMAEESVQQFTLDKLLVGVVGLVGAVFLLHLLIRLLSLGRIHFYSKPSQWQDYLFRNVLFPIVPFSFFNKIYVHRAQHEEPELYDIFKHEDIHVKGLHTVDILWFEMLLIGCWYNPFVWLMRKAVRQNLEFLTDQQVLDKGVDRQTYQYSLLHVTREGATIGISNHFNFKSLKKRIMMMNKKRSSKLELSKYAFLLPILILTGASFTVSKAESKIEEMVQKAENISLDVMLPSTNGNEQKKVDLVETEKEKNEIVQDAAKQSLINLLQGKVSSLVIDEGTAKDQQLSLKSVPAHVLFIVDGIKMSKGYKLNNLNPEAIHSVSILKDKSAVSLFGEEARDGVIQITTKEYVARSKKEGVLITVTPPDRSISDSTIRNIGLKNSRIADSVLYIIDGKDASKDILSRIGPNDIESFSVLKDAAATAIYGEKGKYGVIIITTKVAKPSSSKSNVVDVLQGKVAGVQIAPRDTTKSTGSFVLRNKPVNILYVLDGMPQEADFDLKKLNPNDIERVAVLKDKDAAATAIYGEKGKHGVILITTKAEAAKKKNLPDKVPGVEAGKQIGEIQKDRSNKADLDESTVVRVRSSGQQGLFGSSDATIKEFLDANKGRINLKGDHVLVINGKIAKESDLKNIKANEVISTGALDLTPKNSNLPSNIIGLLFINDGGDGTSKGAAAWVESHGKKIGLISMPDKSRVPYIER